MKSVKRARLKKTNRFWDDRGQFLHDLAEEVGKLQRRAEAIGMLAAVRLNGTSDLPYERYKVPGTDKNIMELFPAVQFYDYTKLENRFIGKKLPANYHLTFSRAEDNDHKLAAVLEYTSASVVFSGKLPATWRGYPVIDGDEHDARFTDAGPGTIIGLTAKGKARHDGSGFVDAKELASVLPKGADGKSNDGWARELIALVDEDGDNSTLVPLKIYFVDGRAKVLIGVAEGRKKSDKRQDIAKREAQRDMDRAMRRRGCSSRSIWLVVVHQHWKSSSDPMVSRAFDAVERLHDAEDASVPGRWSC